MASKFIAKYPVPDEFPDILHDFAREVLRDQPDDIYEYGAQYFKALYNVSEQIRKHFAKIKQDMGSFPIPIYEGNTYNISYGFQQVNLNFFFFIGN